MQQDILSMTMEQLRQSLAEAGEPAYRAGQIYAWLHQRRVTDPAQWSDIPKTLREKVTAQYRIDPLVIEKKLSSALDDTVKYLFRLADGHYIEAVLMHYHHGWSLCISTQVGCRMGCRFCASAVAGFVRNLTPAEMLLQVYTAAQDSMQHIDRVVLMGIGEPLDNYENVMQFLSILSSPAGYGLSLRHVSLSTCGIVPQIYALAQAQSGLTLCLSLHSAIQEKRAELMPVARRYALPEVMAACQFYFQKTGRRVTMEYAVISGENDRQADADALAALVGGMQCHINLIPVNPIRERSYHSGRQGAQQFARLLEKRGLHATVRRTLGQDIEAACGQLRRDTMQDRDRE